MSRGREAPSTIAGSLSPESSRFVPKVNETSPMRRRACARLTTLRRQLLAQVALDRERGRGRAEQVLMTATA